MEVGIAGSPDWLSSKELHDRAWVLVQRRFDRARDRAAAQYRQLLGTGRTAAERKQVVPAAYPGEVEPLFVALDRQRGGRFDPATGRVDEHERPSPASWPSCG